MMVHRLSVSGWGRFGLDMGWRLLSLSGCWKKSISSFKDRDQKIEARCCTDLPLFNTNVELLDLCLSYVDVVRSRSSKGVFFS